jgi:hypothetical protein
MLTLSPTTILPNGSYQLTIRNGVLGCNANVVSSLTISNTQITSVTRRHCSSYFSATGTNLPDLFSQGSSFRILDENNAVVSGFDLLSSNSTGIGFKGPGTIPPSTNYTLELRAPTATCGPITFSFTTTEAAPIITDIVQADCGANRFIITGTGFTTPFVQVFDRVRGLVNIPVTSITPTQITLVPTTPLSSGRYTFEVSNIMDIFCSYNSSAIGLNVEEPRQLNITNIVQNPCGENRFTVSLSGLSGVIQAITIDDLTTQVVIVSRSPLVVILPDDKFTPGTHTLYVRGTCGGTVSRTFTITNPIDLSSVSYSSSSPVCKPNPIRITVTYNVESGCSSAITPQIFDPGVEGISRDITAGANISITRTTLAGGLTRVTVTYTIDPFSTSNSSWYFGPGRYFFEPRLVSPGANTVLAAIPSIGVTIGEVPTIQSAEFKLNSDRASGFIEINGSPFDFDIRNTSVSIIYIFKIFGVEFPENLTTPSIQSISRTLIRTNNVDPNRSKDFITSTKLIRKSNSVFCSNSIKYCEQMGTKIDKARISLYR